MVEFLATIGIIGGSVGLFAYWFRYTSLLILSARTTRDYASEIAMANQLSFMEVQARLQAGGGTELDRLRDMLDRDFALMQKMLEKSTAETSMLAVNYRMMQAWYRVSSRFSESTACQALEEMSQVVAHFANTMGEQASAAAAA